MEQPTQKQPPLQASRMFNGDGSGVQQPSAPQSLLQRLPSGAIEGGLQPPLRRYTISPRDRRYRWWQTLMAALVVYSSWALPFELAFPASRASLAVYDIVLNVFFAVDITLTFFVASWDKSTGLLLDDHMKIALRYITRPWFAMDVASTMPLQFMYRTFTGRQNRGNLLSFANLLRLWRLRHVSGMFPRYPK